MKFTSLTLSIIILQLLRWLNIISFIFVFGIFLYSLFVEKENAMIKIFSLYLAPSAIANLILATLLYFVIKGLLKQRRWARVITIILGVLMLFVFPIGTLIGILLIYGTTIGWTKKPTEIINKNEETNNLP